MIEAYKNQKNNIHRRPPARLSYSFITAYLIENAFYDEFINYQVKLPTEDFTDFADNYIYKPKYAHRYVHYAQYGAGSNPNHNLLNYLFAKKNNKAYGYAVLKPGRPLIKIPYQEWMLFKKCLDPSLRIRSNFPIPAPILLFSNCELLVDNEWHTLISNKKWDSKRFNKPSQARKKTPTELEYLKLKKEISSHK